MQRTSAVRGKPESAVTQRLIKSIPFRELNHFLVPRAFAEFPN